MEEQDLVKETEMEKPWFGPGLGRSPGEGNGTPLQ